MERNLEFLETYTVEQFKVLQHVDKLQVKQNPKNGKLFFTFGAKVGAVSKKGVPTHPMISHVRGDEGEFYMLHEEGQGGAPVVAEF